MKKPKFKKKYAQGSSYVQPEYNTEAQQRKAALGNTFANAGIAAAGTGGAALQNSALQPNYNNPEQGINTGKYAGGKALSGAASGAEMGKAFGPFGQILGAAGGAVYGGVTGVTDANRINSNAKALRNTNANIKKQAGYAATEIEQIGYAKKGLDMTKNKLKKYPGGTGSVATKKQIDPSLPRFTAAETETLRPLQGTPQYKQALHSAIDYTPKYINPRPGSQQAAYEDSVYNQKLATFNSRDLTKAPANFGNAIPAFDANTQKNNLNYNSQNTRLDSFVANGGAALPNNLSIPNVPGQMPNAMKKVPPYKNGTKGISKYPNGTGKIASEQNIALTPAERSALPPTGTPEHRQAIWDLLGYQPKTYPAGSQGYANQEKHFNTAVDLVNQGYRPATSPSGGKGYSKVYEKGSKKIEVEGDEIQLAKKGNKFVVKNDFKNGPTHAEGGIEITAQEGDIITPANKRSQVVEAINTGDHKKLESIRKGLPKDKPYKMKKGGTVKKDTRDKSEPVSASPKDFKPFDNGYSSTQLKKIKSVNTNENRVGRPSKNSDGLSNLGNTLGTIGEIAPIAYNIGQGLFGKVQKTNRRNVNPSNFQYTDNSQPLRNEINSLYNQDKQSIRNASGGNAGTYLANTGLASANKFKRLQEVNNAEAARKVQTQNANTELQNNAQLVNTNLNNQYDEQDLQNSARKQDFLAAGLGQASQFAQTAVVDKRLANRDQTIVNNLQTGNYYIDPATQKVVYGKKGDAPKQSKGNAGIKSKKKYKMKKS